MSEVIQFLAPSGRVVKFKRPGPYTYTQALRAIPSIAQRPSTRGRAGQAETVTLRVFADDLDDYQFTVERLCLCSIDPRLTTTFPEPAGRTHVDELGKDFDAILAEFIRNDTTEAEVAEIDPLSAAEPSSAGSIQPVTSGAADPPSSSPEI